MTKRLLWAAFASLVLGLASGRPAMADGVTTFITNGSSCSGCPAATYQLQFDNTSGNNFAVTLTVTFSNTATIGAKDDQISAVAFDMGTLSSIVGSGLTAAPGGASNWTTSNNGISSSNDAASCTNNGANFVCSRQNFGMSGQLLDLAAVTDGGMLIWTWDVTGTLVPDDFHIGAKYNSTNCMSDTTNCTEGLIVSDTMGTITTDKVPEPASLAILGTGLLAMGGLVRRRLVKS